MDELTEIAKQLPFTEHGAPRLALLKKAYEIADQENLTDYQIDMRLDYIDEATFYDDIMLIYVLFPEVLKLHDKPGGRKRTLCDDIPRYVGIQMAA